MRQQNKVIVWPAYFDSAKTRKEGRRIPKNMAVLGPKASEIKDATDKLHIICELVPDRGYAKTPWLKTGMVLIKKNKETKEAIIQKIASQIQKNRSAAMPKL